MLTSRSEPPKLRLVVAPTDMEVQPVSAIAAQKKRLLEVVGEFDTAIIVKQIGRRPPLVFPAPVAVAEGRNVNVAMRDHSDELAEIEKRGDIVLSFQSDDRFAWIRGVARVERDRTNVERQWSAAFDGWFPDGPLDPGVCIVSITCAEGEYWDYRGSGGLGHVLETAKAYLIGSEQQCAPPHGRVKLSSCPARRKPRKTASSTPRKPSAAVEVPGAASNAPDFASAGLLNGEPLKTELVD